MLVRQPLGGRLDDMTWSRMAFAFTFAFTIHPSPFFTIYQSPFCFYYFAFCICIHIHIHIHIHFSLQVWYRGAVVALEPTLTAEDVPRYRVRYDATLGHFEEVLIMMTA